MRGTYDCIGMYLVMATWKWNFCSCLRPSRVKEMRRKCEGGQWNRIHVGRVNEFVIIWWGASGCGEASIMHQDIGLWKVSMSERAIVRALS